MTDDVGDTTNSLYFEQARPCWHCSRPTHWVELAFEAPLCPGPCTAFKWREYTDANLTDRHEQHFTCPVCLSLSAHPMDKLFGYCGHCHSFTGRQDVTRELLGLVVPADQTKPTYVVRWTKEDELLPLLYREIGCELVDSFRIRHPSADLTVWVDDTGLMEDDIAHNDRALGLARGLGYQASDLAGNAVITGPPNPDGDMAGLTPDMTSQLVRLFQRASQLNP